MKKIYTICSFFVVTCAVKLYAQPTFTSSSVPAPGTNVTIYEVNSNGISEGNAGANQTWNFASFPATGTTYSNQYVLPSSTPFAATFPSANLAVAAPTTMGNFSYSFFSSNSSQAELNGLAVQGTPTVVYNFSNPRKLLVFPLTFNTTFTDTYTSFASYTSTGITVNQYQYGNVTFLADAWGSVTTVAGGPYTNCLRSKTINYNVDSSVYVGFPIPATVTVQNLTSFNWSKNSAFESVFNISRSIVTSNGQTFYDTTAQYSTLFTGLNENSLSLKPFEVYPNPVVNSSVINLVVDELNSGSTKFTATDLQGKVVKQFDFNLMSANHKHVSVDVADLSAGLYLIRLEQKDAQFISRFVKQ